MNTIFEYVLSTPVQYYRPERFLRPEDLHKPPGLYLRVPASLEYLAVSFVSRELTIKTSRYSSGFQIIQTLDLARAEYYSFSALVIVSSSVKNDYIRYQRKLKNSLDILEGMHDLI